MPLIAAMAPEAIFKGTKMELINLEGEELADFAKVLKLFRGQVENDENGTPKTAYCKSGSKEEKEAIQALTRFLRSEKPLPPMIRQLLAEVFNPDLRAEAVKKIEIKNRKVGRTSDLGRDLMFTKFIYLEHHVEGHSLAKIFTEISDLNEIEYSVIEKIWYKNRKRIYEYYDKLDLLKESQKNKSV